MASVDNFGSGLGNSGSGSSDPPFRNNGSGSSDPHLEKVDPDPGEINNLQHYHL